MKTVLIVNECASDNIGDHAISFGVLQLIRDLNVNAESAYFSTKKSKLKTNGKVATRTAFSVLKEVLSKNKFLSFFHWFVTNISRVYQSISKTHEAVIIGGGAANNVGASVSSCYFHLGNDLKAKKQKRIYPWSRVR